MIDHMSSRGEEAKAPKISVGQFRGSIYEVCASSYFNSPLKQGIGLMARGVNHRRVALYAFFAIVFLFLIIYAHGRTWSFLFLSAPVSEGEDSENVLSPAVKG